MDQPRITRHDSVAALEAPWRMLEQGHRWPFQCFGWQSAWAETLGRRVRPCPVLVEDAQGPAMILPLGVFRRGALRVLGFLGGDVSDYHAPLLRPGFAPEMAALWPRLLGALPPADLVELERMPPEIEGVPNPMAALPGAVEHDAAFSLRLPPSLDALLGSRRANLRADSRRKRRRLGEVGPLRHEIAATPEGMEAALAAMMARKSRRWLETGNADAFADPAMGAFYRLASARCPAVASTLMVGDEVVAAHWGLRDRGRFLYLMVGWSAGEWARLSVGRIMVEELLGEAIAQGDAVFDLTVGGEAYKLDWSDARMPLLRWDRALTWRGHAVLAARRAREAARARPWLRRLVRRLRGRG